MEEENTDTPAKRAHPQSRKAYGAVVLGVLVAVGIFIWPDQFPLLKNATPTATSTEISFAVLSSADTPAPAVTATNPPEPATPTAIPTDVIVATLTSQVATATPTTIASPTILPTTVPVTDAPTTELPPTDSLITAVPTATPIPWPTINPTLLPKPPAGVDLSRTHLWFSRPVEGNNVPASTYRFGMTFNQRLVPHRAVDIANKEGTSVVTVGPGTIFYAGEDQEEIFGPQPAFYGKVVVIEMDQRWEGHAIYALYGHLDSVAVITGQTVSQGDVVGSVGSSGVAIASHLHFEVRQDDPNSYRDVRNPELWYWPFRGRGVLAGRVIDANGYFMPGNRVTLECQDGAPRYVETYWDQSTPPDDILMENFVISDLPAGTCRVWSDLFGEVVEEVVDIHPGELSMVILQARP